MDPSIAELLLGCLSGALGGLIALRGYKATLDQYRLSASTAAADWLRDLRTWASEAIDVLAEAAYHSPGSDSSAAHQHDELLRRCRCRLSALIDRGRLFLPTNGKMLLEATSHVLTAACVIQLWMRSSQLNAFWTVMPTLEAFRADEQPSSAFDESSYQPSRLYWTRKLITAKSQSSCISLLNPARKTQLSGDYYQVRTLCQPVQKDSSRLRVGGTSTRGNTANLDREFWSASRAA